MNKPSVGILGHTGMVGSTIFNYYKKKDHEVKGWSRSNQTHDFLATCESDYIFICVPTPYDFTNKKYDISIVHGTLAKINGPKKVIIKSTVPPGTTVKFQEEFKNLYLFFNPEFLSEATAETDFINPDRQILGYTNQSFKFAIETLHFLPNSPYDVMMKATEAEIVKYVNNFHGALMVIFANLIYDICQKTESDYEKVKKAGQASKWVGSPMGRMYWEVWHRGFRGYGGKCFPKDVNTLLDWTIHNEIPNEIIEAVYVANKRILKSQNLSEAQAERIGERQV